MVKMFKGVNEQVEREKECIESVIDTQLRDLDLTDLDKARIRMIVVAMLPYAKGRNSAENQFRKINKINQECQKAGKDLSKIMANLENFLFEGDGQMIHGDIIKEIESKGLSTEQFSLALGALTKAAKICSESDSVMSMAKTGRPFKGVNFFVVSVGNAFPSWINRNRRAKFISRLLEKCLGIKKTPGAITQTLRDNS